MAGILRIYSITILIIINDCTMGQLNEGSQCTLHDSSPGVCKDILKCKWAKRKLDGGELTYNDISRMRCRFEGLRDIICCGDDVGSVQLQPVRPSSGFVSDEYIFENTGQSEISGPSLSSSRLACNFYRDNIDKAITYHILGGKRVSVGEFPHMVAIGISSGVVGSQKYEYICGGSIISKDWILSAAHCCNRNDLEVIRIGSIHLDDIDIEDEDRKYLIERSIAEIKIHPQYRSNRKYNDIGLLRLNQSIDFDNYHRPACLYDNLNDLSGTTELIVTGWGDISVERKIRSRTLLKTNLTAVNVNECNTSVLEYNADIRAIPSGIISTQLCAKDDLAEHDTCEGDSGGPLQIYDKDKRLSTIVGVTSFGIACGTALPSIYTRVAAFITDFIEPNVWPNGFQSNQ